MEKWTKRRVGPPFVLYATIDTGRRFRFAGSDDVNTKLERYGWYERPDGERRSVVGTTLVVPIAQ